MREEKYMKNNQERGEREIAEKKAKMVRERK
jgi:hypothetical protein